MKKALKYVGIILGSIIGLVLLAAAFIAFKPLPNYQEEFPVQDLQVELSSSRIAVGAQLSAGLCNHCHGDQGSMQGKLFVKDPNFGDLFAPNITQHAAGIKDYTDGELYRLLRTGVLKDGKLALPMMTRLPNAAEEDILSIIAFLRSDDASVQPSEKTNPVFEPNFLAKMLFTVAFKPIPLQEVPEQRPEKSSDASYGHYIANNLFVCFDCHSASFETNDFVNPEASLGFYRGGTQIAVGDMEPVTSANITMDKENGIGGWTADQFLTTVKYGKKPDGTMITYPMLPYNFLDSTEVYAIYNYLKTVPLQSEPQQADLR